jgi:hypothetical protein
MVRSIPSVKGSVRESDARCAAFLRLLPLIPPAPFSHTGRRGSLRVLIPETDDGAQGLPQKPAPVRWQCLGARASGAPAGGDARVPDCASGAPAGGDARVPDCASGAPAGGDARVPARWQCLLKGRVLRSDARCAAFPRLLPLIPPAPFSHTGRRGSLSVLMPETDDGAQGLPRAQGGLQPARAPARQPRRGFPVLREGFSPHERRRARAGGLRLA